MLPENAMEFLGTHVVVCGL